MYNLNSISNLSPPANTQSLNEFVTKDLGFPAEKLLIENSKSLKNRVLIQFLIDLDQEECTHLKNEETRYGKANEDWKKITPLLWKITYTGLGIMIGSILLGSRARSEVATTLASSSFFAGFTGFASSLVGITHYNLSTGFQEVATARFNRLYAKVQAIQSKIANSPSNDEEIDQLKKALTYFNQTFTEWNGRTITDDRLPFSTTLKMTINSK